MKMQLLILSNLVSVGGAHLLFSLMVDCTNCIWHKNRIVIFRRFLNWKLASQKPRKARMGIS